MPRRVQIRTSSPAPSTKRSRLSKASESSTALANDQLDKTPNRGLEGDRAAVGLLMLLYTLQGIPMGLGGSVPFLMQARGISMTEQATFSMVAWPFALKLLWAPLVDSLYVGRIGRRKTWIVPAQLVMGVLLIWAGQHIDRWLGDSGVTGGSSEPDVGTLTMLFLGFYFLAATQDIAVDGLALTILSPRNKELGATCNAIGQTVGYFLACVRHLFAANGHLCLAATTFPLCCSSSCLRFYLGCICRHGVPCLLLCGILQPVSARGHRRVRYRHGYPWRFHGRLGLCVPRIDAVGDGGQGRCVHACDDTKDAY